MAVSFGIPIPPATQHSVSPGRLPRSADPAAQLGKLNSLAHRVNPVCCPRRPFDLPVPRHQDLRQLDTWH